jgi:hypothetical protein
MDEKVTTTKTSVTVNERLQLIGLLTLAARHNARLNLTVENPFAGTPVEGYQPEGGRDDE